MPVSTCLVVSVLLSRVPLPALPLSSRDGQHRWARLPSALGSPSAAGVAPGRAPPAVAFVRGATACGQTCSRRAADSPADKHGLSRWLCGMTWPRAPAAAVRGLPRLPWGGRPGTCCLRCPHHPRPPPMIPSSCAARNAWADTSSVPAHLRPVVISLTNLYKVRGRQLAAPTLNPEIRTYCTTFTKGCRRIF